ncbi:unnamed protein product [Closterium sp. Yama58-4]|nr:unnamed protein product [Closterium sp. Yama58-4]
MSKHYRAIRSFLPTATAVGKRLSRQTSQEIVLGGGIGVPLAEASSLVPRSNTIAQSSFGALRPNGPAISTTSSAASASSAPPSAALSPAESSFRRHHDHSCSPSLAPSATPYFPSSTSLPSAFLSPASTATVGGTISTDHRRFAEPPTAAVLPVFGVARRTFPGPSPLSKGTPGSWSDSAPAFPGNSAFPAAVPAAVSAADAAAAPTEPAQCGVLLRRCSATGSGVSDAEFLQHDWMRRAAWMRLATAGAADNGADDAAATAHVAEHDYSERRDDEIGDGEKCTATADDSALDASNGTTEAYQGEEGKTADRRNHVDVASRPRHNQASSATRFLPKPPTASATNLESVLNGDEDPGYWVDSAQTYHSVGWIGSNQHRRHELRHERLAAACAPSSDTCLISSHTSRSYPRDHDTNAAGWLDDRDRTVAESWVNDSRRSLDEVWMDSARSRIRDAALQLVEAQQAALEHSRVASAMEAAMLERQSSLGRQTSLGRSPGGNGAGGKARKSMLSWSPPANDVGVCRSTRSSPMRRFGMGGWGGGSVCDNVGVACNGDGNEIDLVAGKVCVEGFMARTGGNSPLGRVGMIFRLGSSKGVVSTS